LALIANAVLEKPVNCHAISKTSWSESVSIELFVCWIYAIFATQL